jgi:hemerythrin
VTYFEWTNAIELGHTQIDEQHKQLLLLGKAAVVNTLMKFAEHKPPDQDQLQELIDYTQEHFLYEEDLMRTTGYPRVNEHTESHATLLVELRAFCHRVQRDLHINPVGLVTPLWKWLAEHIDAEDRELVVWLKSHDPADRGSSIP